MKKIFVVAGLALGALFYGSCDEASSFVEPEADIAEGLKKALEVGTDTAVSRLNVTDGYLKDQAVKILLPDEIEEKIAALKAKDLSFPNPLSTDFLPLADISISGENLYNNGLPALSIEALSSKEDLLIEGINRAAESAAADAKPIFVDAITGMTIADANSILFGSDSAATVFLEDNTRSGLFTNFEPKIEAALQTVKVGDVAISTRYENFVSAYNTVLGKGVGDITVSSLSGIEPIGATDISQHATDKALDGLFLKVQDQEEQIRIDPLARVTDLLKDVFGKLDE